MPFPPGPRIRRHAPRSVGDAPFAYRRYRQCLRQDFSGTCVYCGFTERQVAPGLQYGGFEIEHYRPKEKFRKLRNKYANLLWSCAGCNRAKLDKWPSSEEATRGYRFLNPTKDDLGARLLESGLEVIPRDGDDRAAQYTIDELELNSEAKKELRRGERQRLDDIEALKGCIALMEELAETSPDPEDLLNKMRELEDQLERLIRPETFAPPSAIGLCICG